MTDWFRSWHGAPTDPKWMAIAKRAGVATGMVVAVAWALMDRASQVDERGNIEGYDADALACFYGCEPEHVQAIVAAMTDKGMIEDGRFVNWSKRQPKREDDSTERVRAHRARNASQPIETQVKRTVTHGNSREDKRREDNTSPSLRSGEGARAKRLTGSDELTDEMRADAEAVGLPPQRHDAEWAKMRDWSLAAKDGARKDWRAAWRNWCRRAADDQPRARGSPAQQPRPPSQADVFAMIARKARDDPQQDDSPGPRPVIPHLSAVGSG